MNCNRLRRERMKRAVMLRERLAYVSAVLFTALSMSLVFYICFKDLLPEGAVVPIKVMWVLGTTYIFMMVAPPGKAGD